MFNHGPYHLTYSVCTIFNHISLSTSKCLLVTGFGSGIPAISESKLYQHKYFIGWGQKNLFDPTLCIHSTLTSCSSKSNTRPGNGCSSHFTTTNLFSSWNPVGQCVVSTTIKKPKKPSETSGTKWFGTQYCSCMSFVRVEDHIMWTVSSKPSHRGRIMRWRSDWMLGFPRCG